MSAANYKKLPSAPRNPTSNSSDEVESLDEDFEVTPKRRARLRDASAGPPHHGHGDGRPKTVGARGRGVLAGLFASFWAKNRGILLVGFSQLFGALMNLTARLLELEGAGMHPLQVLFARQSLTTICSCIYMYWTNVPDFPFGKREVRLLLVARGVSGFFGIFCLW